LSYRFPFGCVVSLMRTTTFYRKETFLRHTALNVYQGRGAWFYWISPLPARSSRGEGVHV
jgi:hypothetical protein